MKMSVKTWGILFIILLLVIFNNDINFVNGVAENDTKSYSLSTPGCKIKRLDPWDKSITQYFKKLPPMNCPKEPIDVLVHQTADKKLKLDERAMGSLVKEHKTNLACTKRAVYRNKWEKDERKEFRLSDNVTKFTKETPMDMEYAQIQCSSGKKSVYENYFFYPHRKPEVEKECGENLKKHLAAHPLCREVPQLSVLVLGIDSLSQQSLVRHMPKTIDYVTKTLSGIFMSGYNRVALNTYPNLIPYLTGQSQEELHKSCLNNDTQSKFDNCTFLQDIFFKAGYRTSFVENMDYAGLFLFNRGGFHRQLAHYYSHTIYVPIYKDKPDLLKEMCWRGKPHDERIFDWASMYQQEFSKDLHYGHFWTSELSHDRENDPQLMDPFVSSVLKKMYDVGSLNNTLLVMMSDHGIRTGKFSQTKIGKLEENLPFMYLIFPAWFRERFPAVIKTVSENGHRLVTTFDLHETLKSIINCDYAKSTKETPQEKRGTSLFKPISDRRNCKTAGIPDEYCSCEGSVKGG